MKGIIKTTIVARNIFNEKSPKDFTADVVFSATGCKCGDKWDVNYSSILSCLIQQAGRWCEHYASDLFIDWKSIDKSLDDGSMRTKQYLFGFRQSGVDGNTYVTARYMADPHDEEYRAVWVLDIQTVEDNITMRLGRIR